jgi:hypothetical protein
MDLAKTIQELRDELQGIDETIAALTRLGVGQKRRGRPPKWLTVSTAAPEKPRGRKAKAVEK